MSHAHGRVIHDGRVVGYFEYNGTADVVCSRIHESPRGVDEHWRGNDVFRDCTCQQPSIPVLIWTSYGYGFYWPGRACLACRAIVDGLMPFRCDYDDCRWESYFRNWPRDGYPAVRAGEVIPEWSIAHP